MFSPIVMFPVVIFMVDCAFLICIVLFLVIILYLLSPLYVAVTVWFPAGMFSNVAVTLLFCIFIVCVWLCIFIVMERFIPRYCFLFSSYLLPTLFCCSVVINQSRKSFGFPGKSETSAYSASFIH